MSGLVAEQGEFIRRIERIGERIERHLERMRELEAVLDGQLREAEDSVYDTQSDSDDSDDDDSTVDLRELGLINGVRFAADDVVINQEGWDDGIESDAETVVMNFTPFDYYQNGGYDSDAETVVPEYREWWCSPQ